MKKNGCGKESPHPATQNLARIFWIYSHGALIDMA